MSVVTGKGITMIQFKLDELQVEIKTPYYEDARADFAPYYTAGRGTKETEAQAQIAAELGKLGAFIIGCFRGEYLVDGHKRYGYEIRFSFGGHQGIIRAAGLPMKYPATERKVHLIRIQALLNVRDWLKSAVTTRVFAPGHSPLLPHMLLPDGETTIAEYIAQQQMLPMLAPQSEEVIIE